MSILKRRKHDEKATQSFKSHNWVTYLNPRNKKIKVEACTICGVLRLGNSLTTGCINLTSRKNNILIKKGWVEHQVEHQVDHQKAS